MPEQAGCQQYFGGLDPFRKPTWVGVTAPQRHHRGAAGHTKPAGEDSDECLRAAGIEVARIGNMKRRSATVAPSVARNTLESSREPAAYKPLIQQRPCCINTHERGAR